MSFVNENWSALFGGASAKRCTSWRSCRGAGFLLANGAARELRKILRRWHRTPSLAYVDNYRVVLPTASNIVGLMALPFVTSSPPGALLDGGLRCKGGYQHVCVTKG
jgi:hypothetical protein